MQEARQRLIMSPPRYELASTGMDNSRMAASVRRPAKLGERVRAQSFWENGEIETILIPGEDEMWKRFFSRRSGEVPADAGRIDEMDLALAPRELRRLTRLDPGVPGHHAGVEHRPPPRVEVVDVDGHHQVLLHLL